MMSSRVLWSTCWFHIYKGKCDVARGGSGDLFYCCGCGYYCFKVLCAGVDGPMKTLKHGYYCFCRCRDDDGTQCVVCTILLLRTSQQRVLPGPPLLLLLELHRVTVDDVQNSAAASSAGATMMAMSRVLAPHCRRIYIFSILVESSTNHQQQKCHCEFRQCLGNFALQQYLFVLHSTLVLDTGASRPVHFWSCCAIRISRGFVLNTFFVVCRA